MNLRSRDWKDVFLWTGSIIGFIADISALLILISSIDFEDSILFEPPSIPRFSLGSIVLEWRDVTLVGLVYVGLAFIIISHRTSSFRLMAILAHLFAVLVLPWTMLFAPLWDWWFYLDLAIGWVVGFITLLMLTSQELRRGVVRLLVSLLILMPAWVLIERGLHQLPWNTAVTWVLGVTLASMVISAIYWAIALVVLTIVLLPIEFIQRGF